MSSCEVQNLENILKWGAGNVWNGRTSAWKDMKCKIIFTIGLSSRKSKNEQLVIPLEMTQLHALDYPAFFFTLNFTWACFSRLTCWKVKTVTFKESQRCCRLASKTCHGDQQHSSFSFVGRCRVAKVLLHFLISWYLVKMEIRDSRF